MKFNQFSHATYKMAKCEDHHIPSCMLDKKTIQTEGSEHVACCMLYVQFRTCNMQHVQHSHTTCKCWVEHSHLQPLSYIGHLTPPGFLEVVTLFPPLPYEVRWKPLQSKIRPLQDIIILNLNTWGTSLTLLWHRSPIPSDFYPLKTFGNNNGQSNVANFLCMNLVSLWRCRRCNLEVYRTRHSTQILIIVIQLYCSG